MIFKKFKSTIYIMMILCLLILSISSLLLYRTSVRDLIKEKSQEDLKQYTDQSVELFNYVIDDYFRQLEIMASLSVHISQESQDQLMELIRSINLEKPYLNFSIISSNGFMYDGSGNGMADVHDRPYFIRAMQGEQVVSKVYKNEINDADAILLATPIYDDGVIKGVVVARYEITAFISLVGNSQYQGHGTTMIMASDGTVISGYDGMEHYDTVYDALSVFEFDDEHALDTMAQHALAGQDGFITYHKDGKDRFLYYEPIGREGWMMFSLVMADGLYGQYQEIANLSYGLLFVNIIMYGVILVFVYLTYREIKRTMRENQRDPLTKAYNKVSAKALSETILKHSDPSSLHACFFIDIDNFKQINDTYGHKAGDEMIVHCNDVLSYCFRRSDVISRFGGDEFFVLMRDIKSKEYVENKAKVLLESFAKNPYAAHISIGMALYCIDGKTFEELLHNADQALYQAKEMGKNTYAFYHKEKS